MSRVLRILSATCTALLGFPGAHAQQPPAADVTFVVPVNLSRLMPDLTRIRVNCGIGSTVLQAMSTLGQPSVPTGLSRSVNVIGSSEVAVTQGVVNQSVQVTVPVAQSAFLASAGNPSGQVAQYECALVGYSNASQSWAEFITVNPVRPQQSMYWLTPLPTRITGQFVW